MKAFLRRILWFILRFIPLKNIILLESSPTLADNTGALFKRMLELGWNKKYKFVWVSNDGITSNDYENTVFIARTDSLKLFLYRCVAKMIIDCNQQLLSLNPKTVHIYLAHGSSIKSVKSYYFCNSTTDYVLCQSEYFSPIDADELHVREDQLVICGYPRNDELFSDNADLPAIFGKFSKYVVWYPTFRQGKSAGRKHSSISMPVIHNAEIAEKINDAAKALDILIIVKPHPVQDVSLIKDLGLSNICFIDNSLFDNNGITSYEFVAKTDALITDYSSIFCDYLLIDKPIGLTFEDFDEYSKTPGLAVEPEVLTCCSEMLYTAEDFTKFLNHIANGDDVFKTERDRIKALMNKYTDGHSSDRVIDFISSKLH